MSGDLGDQAIKELRLFIKPTSGFTPKIMEMQIAYPGRREYQALNPRDVASRLVQDGDATITAPVREQPSAARRDLDSLRLQLLAQNRDHGLGATPDAGLRSWNDQGKWSAD
jgi:hypothetical protein